MGEKIVIGPINRGLRNDRTPFVIDNDSFPVLVNAYQWRGRVKRKRGTAPLNNSANGASRLTRYFDSTSTAYNTSGSTTITLDGSGVGNLLTGFGLEANGNIVIGSVTITAPGPTVYTDNGDGTLSPSGTINYATGVITIAAEAGNAVSATFHYTPNLPVMGIEDLIIGTEQYPGTIAFDTTYAYNIQVVSPYSIYSVSFYNNPASGTYPGYIQKSTWSPVNWNGGDYQQFWTTNYQGALWATNGVSVPFVSTNIGMQFKPITGVTIDAAGPPALATLTIVNHGLVQGDFVFIAEVGGISGINYQTGYVVSADPQAANTVQVEFPNAVLGGAYTTGGIAQYLTSNAADPTKDCIRWYNGDPTNEPTLHTFQTGKGWVNYMPPLSLESFSIGGLPAALYYLAGCRMILPFKDRLLFIGPVVQTSSGPPIYLEDSVAYTQNGTAYYTSSFQGPSSLPTSSIDPILVPENRTADQRAMVSDFIGFGGVVQNGLETAIVTSSSNEDVLIMGLENNYQVRFIYTGNDIVPFEFYIINSELGSASTFSIINMDHGILSRGNRGFIMANQNECVRFDLEIPDEVFQIRLSDNGAERFCAQRDFINEWVYFTYPSDNINYKFPTTTLQYNYRDNSWAQFFESYTTYGQFKRVSGFTWATVGGTFPTWAQWNQPWNASNSAVLQPEVLAGNQQGFVMTRGDGTSEAVSLYIQNIASNVVTSHNHNLNNGDYVVIYGALGTVGPLVNEKVFLVMNATTNTFQLNPTVGAGTYLGGGLIKRFYVPFIQTKQFPVVCGDARKTRLGPQQYLLTTTDSGELTLLIFLSQNADSPYNGGPIVPNISSTNNSLIYSTTLYTCPESTNLGLTPANVNLNMPTAIQQSQIWHRMNTSLIGDTVQIGFTLNDEQMRDVDLYLQTAEIELHTIILDVNPSQLLV
jgi:hypothetical protein